MRYGCSQDAGGASRGIAKRPPGSNRSRRSEHDHHALRSIAALVALSYLCFDNVFHEVDVVLSSYPAKMDGRCDLLHIIIHLERH